MSQPSRLDLINYRFCCGWIAPPVRFAYCERLADIPSIYPGKTWHFQEELEIEFKKRGRQKEETGELTERRVIKEVGL